MILHDGLRRIVVVSIGFWCSFQPLGAQLKAAKEKACALHVGVLVQRPDGQPVGRLKQKDFVVSRQGQVLSLTVARPVLGGKVPPGRHVTTRALIILAPPGANSADAFSALLVALKPVWSRGWQVAVARSDGTVTDYATTATQLQQTWSAPVTSAVNAEAAVVNLTSFIGRRIVMYLTGFPKEAIPPPTWLPKLAASAAAEMFVVDGGVPAPPVPTRNIELYPGPDEPANRGAAADQRVEPAIIPGSPNSEGGRGRTRRFESGQYHEVNLHNAVQDSLHVALGYYDLRIKCPSTGMTSSDTTLSLRIEGPSTILITAQAYGHASVPQIKITRK